MLEFGKYTTIIIVLFLLIFRQAGEARGRVALCEAAACARQQDVALVSFAGQPASQGLVEGKKRGVEAFLLNL